MSYYSDFIAFVDDLYSLLRLHLGLACIRGVFSSRIYIADSRHISVFTYFGERGMTGFSSLKENTLLDVIASVVLVKFALPKFIQCIATPHFQI